LRTTVASADMGDISLSLASSELAFSRASFGMPRLDAIFSRARRFSFGASSSSPSSF
jgi:hypothetical protein